jgi:hypothetical protein
VSKQTKTIAKKTTAAAAAPGRAKQPPRRLEPIVQSVERIATPKPVVELPKLRGELPVPVATFYF